MSANDDLGNFRYTPIVVICTDQRLAITTINIESLRGTKIVLVVSDHKEEEYYSRFPVHIVTHPNIPLGAKWQRGVNEAIQLGANPLIILGSDDILAPNSIEKYVSEVSKGHHFIGLKSWWQHHRGKAYLCDYLSRQPLGGGRAYSKQLLSRVGYNLFNPRWNTRLDDQGWKAAGEPFVINDPLIHAIKGNWPVINRFNPTHRNIKVREVSDSDSVLCQTFGDKINFNVL